jgi:PAS domain S-box-containing protein
MKVLEPSVAQRILLIEDNDDDAELLMHQLETLKNQGISFVDHCNCVAAGLRRLKESAVELIILDLSLPDSQGIETFLKVYRCVPSIPIIVLTGTDDDDLAKQALRSGAQDYLIKGRIDAASLYRSISYALERHSASDAHERLAAIVESSTDAIIGKTLNGTITSWNRGAEHLFGYSAEEATGKSVGMLIPVESCNELSEILTAVGKGESILNRETVRINKNGARVEVLASIFPIKREDGTISSAAAIDRDISESKRMMRTLQKTEQRLSLALKAAEVGVWDIDLVNGIVWRSLKHDEIFGHSSLVPDWSFDIFLSYALPGDREHAKLQFQRGIDSGQLKMECRIIRTDKAVRWISAQGETFSDEHGNPVRMMGTVVDITDRKGQEEQHRLMAIMEAREDFMATLTHDMKNPLIGANRLLELLVNGKLGALTNEQRELLQTLMHGNAGVLNLIRNLIEVYKLEGNPKLLSVEEIDLIKLCTSAVSQMTNFANLSGVKFVTEFAEHIEKVSVDPRRMERVLQNLLDNAVKFSPPDGKIVIRIFSRGGQTCIEVQDSGPGIKPKDHALLFQRFSQGDAGKRHAGGSGLGLYLCRQVIEAHGGNIECESQANLATTFRISLPTHKPTPE